MTTPPQAAGYQKTSQATILYAPRGGELTPQRLDIDRVFFFEELATAQETEVLDKVEMAENE